MPAWLMTLLNFLGSLIVKIGTGVINKQLETPAEKTNVENSEGNAVDPGGDFFAECNRVPDRDESK